MIGQGFEVIPTNCAQAAELVDAYDREKGIYGERPALTSVWEQIVEKFSPAKITAATIKSIADPNFEEKQSQKISKGTAKILAARAKKEGKTVDDLVHELLREREEHDCESESVPDTRSPQEQTEELALLDDLDREFRLHAIKKATPAKVARDLAQSVDDLFSTLLGGIVPVPRHHRSPKPM